jgi:hypothetical protein
MPPLRGYGASSPRHPRDRWARPSGAFTGRLQRPERHQHRPPTRGKWIDLCADYGAPIEIVYLEPPLPQLLAQNRNREHAVPESVMHRLLEKLEPPTRVEGHGVRMVG